MTVRVTLRPHFGSDKLDTRVYEKGAATLVDGRGQLLILDEQLDVTSEDRGAVETRLIAHTIATFADGEWSRADVDQ